MMEDTIFIIRLLCGLASIICLFIASIVSGLYHCVDKLDKDSCISAKQGIAGSVFMSWITCVAILGVLYVVRRCLTKGAVSDDRNGRHLRASFRRLGVQLLYMAAATVMPVASVLLLDKVPVHNQVASCALVMSSVLFLSYASFEYDDFGLRDVTESIFLSVLYLTKNHHIRNMFIAAGGCSLGRLTIFLFKEYLRWNHVDGGIDRAQEHVRILGRLENHLQSVGNNDPDTINILGTLRAELET